MRTRLAVAALVAGLATAPFATASHAYYCNPDFQVVCDVIATVCRVKPVTSICATIK